MDSPDPLDQLLRAGPVEPWWERLRAEAAGRWRLVAALVVAVAAVVAFLLLRSPQRPLAVSLPHAGSAPAGGTIASSPGSPTSAATGGVAGGAPSTVATSLVVHVAGAVAAPGLVTLTPGARVADAVDAAGGFRVDADGDRVNLAAPVADGVRVYIPAVGEAEPPAAVPIVGAPPGSGGSGEAGTDAPTPSTPVDLNTATAAQLESLPGVGPSTAAAIIAYRTEHQRFRSVDELEEVRGIGPAKFDALVDLVVAS